MKTKKIIILLLMFVQVINMNGARRFYDSKSMVVGLTTNDNVFYTAGLGSKTFSNECSIMNYAFTLRKNKFDPTDTEQQLNKDQIGKKILDILFERNKGALSEDLLRERAWENVQLTDIERAKFATYSPDLVLKEDILPILESNYILLIHEFDRKDVNWAYGKKMKVAWIVLHVDIDQSKWDEVIACWNNLDKYDKIRVNVSYVASGLVKEKMTMYNQNDHRYSETIRDVAKRVPALAVRGQIISRYPYKAAIGKNNGVKAGVDLVRIYRQSADKNDKYSSKEIGKARVSKVTNEECNLLTVAGRAGSVDKGDIAVLMPTTTNAKSLMYQWQNNMHEIRYDFDLNMAIGGPFTFHLHEIDLRAGFLKNAEEKASGKVNENIENSIFGSIAFGPGFGAIFLRGCELEAYTLLQAEIWSCKAKGEYRFPTDDKEGKNKLLGGYIRLPLGLRFQINLKYPLRITGGVEYSVKLLNFNKDIEEYVMDPQRWNRNDLQFFVGLRYAY